MPSENFEFLQRKWSVLYKHAVLAEHYVYSDPATATIKMRCFAETLVGVVYRELQLPSVLGDGFYEKLKSAHFESVVENPICEKLHAIRCHGNKAAHGSEVDPGKAIQLLKETYLLGCWLHATYSENLDDQPPIFVVPQTCDELDANVSAVNERLANQLKQAKEELNQVQISERQAQEKIISLNFSLNEARLSVFRNASFRALNNIDLQPEKTRELLKIEDAFSEYTLNDGQAELVKRLGHFFSSKTESVFLLRGYAGTGKTFITKGLTEYFRSIGRNYVLAAPTGKAAKVIAEKTKSPSFTLHRTIYSFKKISEYRDDDLEGTETYKFYAELAVNELSADTVFIVDEASMVADIYTESEFFRFGSGYLLRDFLKYVNLDHNDHRKKVIFIGDDAQLPPVGMKFSPALDEGYLFREHSLRSISYELTEVVRQKADSGVMANSIMLRKALQGGVFNQLSVDLQAPDIAKVEHGDLIKRYLESCNEKINGESIVIAYSNADVAAYNRRIREHFFPGRLEVTTDDKVMAVTNSSSYGFFISNGDFGVVRRVYGATERRNVTIKRKNPNSGTVEEIAISLAFRDVRVGFRDLEGNAKFFDAKILEDLLDSDQPSLNSDENKALYVDFCMRNKHLPRGSLEFKHTLMSDPYFNALRLKFGYAITCHKAQGSEWNNVFVKCKANQNQLTAAYFRWFYTAITRTSQRLWLLDPPNLKVGGGIKLVGGSGIGVPQVSPGDIVTHQREPNVPVPDITRPGNLDVEQLAGEPAQPSIQQDSSSDTFGIPLAATFLLGILNRVREFTKNSGIGVDSIAHQQYQEAYTFAREDDFARVDIGYNSKEKITRVVTPIPSQLSSEIQGLLSPLVGTPIAAAGHIAANQFTFDEDFLNEFHERLIPLAVEQEISIQKVVRHPWSLRYSFNRGAEVAVYDIYFDGKQRFTKCQALVTACSPGQLVDDVSLLITQGLSA